MSVSMIVDIEVVNLYKIKTHCNETIKIKTRQHVDYN